MNVLERLNILSNPTTDREEYARVAAICSQELVIRAWDTSAFLRNGIHVVSAAADYKLVLEPVLRLLPLFNDIAVTCLWPVSEVLIEGAVDRTTISMAMSEKQASKMPNLLVMVQSIGTITELEAILTHVLFDMEPNEYNEIIVLSLVSHVDADAHIKGILPERYRKKFRLLDQRKDHELSLDGTLLPGIGGRSIDRAGFESYAASRSFVPAVFRKGYDFEKRPKPESSPSP